MNKMISGASAAVLFGLSAIAGIAPVSAAAPMGHSNFQQQDQYIGNYCGKNPNANQCGDWQANHSHWSNSDYQGFYRGHQHDSGFGGSAAAGLFGLAVGAVVAGAVNNGNSSDHVRACENAYRSYSVQTDTFLGNDGARHPCQV